MVRLFSEGARLLRSAVNLKHPDSLPPVHEHWTNRSIYDDDENTFRTHLNCMGQHCQAATSGLLLELYRYIPPGSEDDDNKEMLQFIREMMLLCEYGRIIRSVGYSADTTLYCKFMGMGNDMRMFVTEDSMEYIEYVGPVHLDAVREVSVFIQSGGKGTMPSIDTLVKVIFSMCTVRDNKWSMDECEYLTPSETFDPTELERCITHDMGKEGNGGMDADKYFDIPRDKVYDEYGNILPECYWTKREIGNEDSDGEEESDGRVGDGKGERSL
jgi:hypothetical protein